MWARIVAAVAQPGARAASAQGQPGTGQYTREANARPPTGDRSRSLADPRSPPAGVPGAAGPGLAASPMRRPRSGQPCQCGRRVGNWRSRLWRRSPCNGGCPGHRKVRPARLGGHQLLFRKMVKARRCFLPSVAEGGLAGSLDEGFSACPHRAALAPASRRRHRLRRSRPGDGAMGRCRLRNTKTRPPSGTGTPEVLRRGVFPLNGLARYCATRDPHENI